MRPKTWIILAALLWPAAPATAQETLFFSGDTLGVSGRTVTFLVEGTTSVAIKGYSVIFSFDSAVLEFVSSTIEGTRAEGAQFFVPGHSERVAQAGVIYSLSCPPEIPPGSGPLLSVTMRVKDDAPLGPTMLVLQDMPPATNRLTACDGASLVPALGIWSLEVCPGPIGVPVLESPADGAVDVAETGTLDWSDVAGASAYTYQIGTECGAGAEEEVTSSEVSYGPLEPWTGYYWRVKARIACGAFGDYAECRSFVTGNTSSAEGSGFRRTGGLWVTPNPVSERALIRFPLDAPEPALVEVFDAVGRLVRTIAPGVFPDVEEARAMWDARDDSGEPLRAGIYYLRVSPGGPGASGRIVVLR